MVLLALKDKNCNYNYWRSCLKCAFFSFLIFNCNFFFLTSLEVIMETHNTQMLKRKFKKKPKKQIHCYNCTCFIFYQRHLDIFEMLECIFFFFFLDGNPRRSLSFCKHLFIFLLIFFFIWYLRSSCNLVHTPV